MTSKRQAPRLVKPGSATVKPLSGDRHLNGTSSHAEKLLKLGTSIESIAKEPSYFLIHDKKCTNELAGLCKQLYDIAKQTCAGYKSENALKELVVDGFDNDQIWEELQLENVPMTSLLNNRLSKLSGSLNEPAPKRKTTAPSAKTKMVDAKKSEYSSEDDSDASDVVVRDVKSHKTANQTNRQADDSEEEEEDGEEEDEDESENRDDINSEDDISEEDENGSVASGEEIMYNDFFDPMATQEGDDNELSSSEEIIEDDEQEVVTLKNGHSNQHKAQRSSTMSIEEPVPKAMLENMSRHEKFLAHMKKHVGQLEEENLAEKPWTLSGEASAKQRPSNSLLDEPLDFEHASRPAPVITEEYTETLEDKIKRRIAEESWDDVNPKRAVSSVPSKQDFELDMEKSKQGLGDIYEQEYQLKAQGKTSQDVISETLQVKHDAVSALFKTLCTKLDALSNFFFTPKPAKEELSVIPNVSAIQMEDMIPVAVSNATLLAPHEIYQSKKRPLKGDSEVTSQEKARLRAKRKRVYKANSVRKSYLEKLDGNKQDNQISKKDAVKQLKAGKNVTIAMKVREGKRK